MVLSKDGILSTVRINVFSYLFQNSSSGKSLFTGNTSNDIYCVATKNEKVASADCEGVIRLWTWTGQIIRVMKEHVGSIRTLHYHPYYEVLISGGDAKFLVLWDSESGTICITDYVNDYITLYSIYRHACRQTTVLET